MANNVSRAGRIADQIQRELAELIRGELKDPRVGLVTVTDVEVSGDYHHARVFFTSLRGNDANDTSLQGNDAIDGLQRASGYLRSRLAGSLRLRTVPELHFVYDESVERGTRLSKLIDEAVAGSRDDSSQVPDD